MSNAALGEQFGPKPEYDSAARKSWTSRVRVGMSEGVTHDGSANGYPIRGMGEWRTESGRNLRVERHT